MRALALFSSGRYSESMRLVRSVLRVVVACLLGAALPCLAQDGGAIGVPIDGPATSAPVPGSIAALADRDGWRLAARTAREIGADGGLCIHPEQALALNAAFSPTEREVGWAHRVEAAYQEACRLGRGVTTVDGEMVDAPVVERARAILALLENQDPAS